MSKIPQGEWNAIAARYANGESISGIARSYACTPPAIHYILKRNRQPPGDRVLPPVDGRPAPMLVRAAEPRHRPAPLWHAAENANAAESNVEKFDPEISNAETPSAGAARPAATPGLDSALHHRAEAAIEVFRTSFDAALAEGSPCVRERLRRAASDLMRVAARTTIVLDRLNASAEGAGRAQNYPRSAHARDAGGRFGPG